MCDSLTSDIPVEAMSASAAVHVKWSPRSGQDGLLLRLLPSQSCCYLLQFILTVELVRVGTYAMLPNASLTPRSLIPLEGDVSEREELSKISGLMIYVCHAHHLCTPCLCRVTCMCRPALLSSSCLGLHAVGQEGTPVCAALSACEALRGGILITCQPVQRWLCWCCRSGSTL